MRAAALDFLSDSNLDVAAACAAVPPRLRAVVVL
jgi:hypothetical protein